MEVLYVQIIAGVHAHLWYLRAITKTQVSERRHMARFAYILKHTQKLQIKLHSTMPFCY